MPKAVVDKARYTAMTVLKQVIEDGAYSNIALKHTIGEKRLGPRDAAFATYLVMGVLERKLYLDAVIGKYMRRWPGHPLVRQALRLGCYQVLFSDAVPDSAAANSAVELCKAAGASGLTALVNGILRNIIRGKEEIRIPQGDSVDDMALRYSCRPWMVEMLQAQYGAGEIEDILGFHTIPTTVYVNPSKDLTREQVIERLSADGWDTQQGRWVPESVRVSGAGSIAGHPLYREGYISIVSESAMLAVKASGAQPGERVLDACAAPGGKTALLAQCVGESGTVGAWDIHPHRVKLIRAQMDRLGLRNIRPAVRDATEPAEEFMGAYDRVLCDMPCTGWGVLSQKPELRFNAGIGEIGELCAVQQAILECCSRYVKPGGVLVYVTCTVNRMENEDIIVTFLDNHQAYMPGDLSAFLPGELHAYIRDKGMIQLLPGRDSVPGFFICRMVRT